MKIIYNGEYDFLEYVPKIIEEFECDHYEKEKLRFKSSRSACIVTVRTHYGHLEARIYCLLEKGVHRGYSVTINEVKFNEKGEVCNGKPE